MASILPFLLESTWDILPWIACNKQWSSVVHCVVWPIILQYTVCCMLFNDQNRKLSGEGQWCMCHHWTVSDLQQPSRLDDENIMLQFIFSFAANTWLKRLKWKHRWSFLTATLGMSNKQHVRLAHFSSILVFHCWYFFLERFHAVWVLLHLLHFTVHLAMESRLTQAVSTNLHLNWPSFPHSMKKKSSLDRFRNTSDTLALVTEKNVK